MRDRTMVMLALLFLTLTIGAGVNKSLEVGNQMMGKKMAPDITEAVRRTAPFFLNQVSVVAEYGKKGTQVISQKYPDIAKEIPYTVKEIQYNLAMGSRLKFQDFKNKFLPEVQNKIMPQMKADFTSAIKNRYIFFKGKAKNIIADFKNGKQNIRQVQ